MQKGTHPAKSYRRCRAFPKESKILRSQRIRVSLPSVLSSRFTIYMQTLTRISVGILIQALYQMSSFAVLFLNMTFPTYLHGYHTRKLSMHCCVLNTAVFFFHGLEKYNPDKWLVPIGQHPIHTAVLLQFSSAMSRPSPVRRFSAGL